MRVDLPDPEGPIIATYSLRSICRFTPRRACTCCSEPMSYVFQRSRVEIMHDSGGADTSGRSILMTSAVAILFSWSSGDTNHSDPSGPLLGRALRGKVTSFL